MKTNKIKKTLCLAMILSLVGGWFHLNVCRAEEGNDVSSLEVLAEQNNKNTQDEPKSETSEAKNPKSDIFESYVLPALLIPLIPVSIGMQIVCMFVTKDASRCIGH